MRFALFLLLCFVAPLSAQIPNVNSGIVDQRVFPDSINGCGPAAVLNLLKFSRQEYADLYLSLLGRDEGIKMRYFVDGFLKSRMSLVYPNRKRWGVHGVQSIDLHAALNEMLEQRSVSKLKGISLARQEGESEGNHLTRCHDLISASIHNGVVPILSLRSFVVRRRERRDFEPQWESGVYHNIVINAVTRPPSSVGFELAIFDPWKGRSGEVLLHREGNRQKFEALEGSNATGRWLEGTPFLQVLSPDLPTTVPLDLDDFERYVLVADYLIGDF